MRFMITFAVFLQFSKLRGIFAFNFCHSLFVFFGGNGNAGIRHLVAFPFIFCLKSVIQTASFPLVRHNFVFRGSVNTP